MNDETAATVDSTAPETAAATGNVASEATPETQGASVPADPIAAGMAGEQPTAQAHAEKAPEGLPEKYEFHLPEGLSMTPEIEGKFTEIAHKIGLTQEQADGLVKLHSDIMMEQMRQAEQQKNAWATECQKAGLSAPEKMKLTRLAIDTFDDTGKLKQELMESGLAYSPTVQRFLQVIGGYLAEDTAPDSKPAPQAKSAADLLFGNSKY